MTSSDWRRLYALHHPLLLTLSSGLLIIGLMTLISPPLFAHTIIARALPVGLEYPWDISLMIGGASILYGAYSLNNKWEASGSILIATCLSIWEVVYLFTQAADVNFIPASLIFLIAVGFGLRAYILTFSDESPYWDH